MINRASALLENVSVHYVGRNSENEGLKLSERPIRVGDELLVENLMKYMLDAFKEPEFFNFKEINDNLEGNPMYSWAKSIFENPESLHANSLEIAKYLYNNSTHPNIKPGELIVSHIEDLLIEDEMTSGIIICKSETKDTFLKIKNYGNNFELKTDIGILLSKLDKACLIFNTDQEDGYKLAIIDKSSPNAEAQFWTKDFLNITNRNDDYYKTKVYIQATKSFVEDRLKPIYELDKKDEAEIMGASKDYLNMTEDFDEENYLDSLFGDEDEIKSEFKNYKKDYESENHLRLQEDFSVSQAAVKSQSKIFKSVIKLDKNFHIYVHGNREMIQKGVDDEGRKYYVLYYDSEQ